MIRHARSSLFFLLCALLILFEPLPSKAQSAPLNAIITLAPISGAAKVEMIVQTLDVNVVEAGDSTALDGQMTFKLHNTDRLARADLVVGFPSWGGGAQELNEKSFNQFVITLNDKPIQPDWQTQPLKLGNETRSVRWLAWPLSLEGDERATIQVTFRQDLGADALPTISFAQAPAILWKGFVGSARYSIHFPALTTPEQFRLLAPQGSTFDGHTLTWLFAEFNPDAPIILKFVKPQVWREITQARAALAQNPTPKAALTLGAQYAQLARASQSVSDWAQAVAAYQRASELEPTSPRASIELAKLYEARLRGEFGAVGAENAARAAALEQWQRALTLQPNNGEARDAIAQHAFALAQWARRNGQFNGALSFLASVREAGSGKLTRAQLDSEERASRAGLALQQAEAGQWQPVLDSIEAGALGQEVLADWKAFQLRFHAVQILINIEGEQQAITVRAAPLPHPSVQHEQRLKQWADGFAKGAEISTEGAVYVLAWSAPLQPLHADDNGSAPELSLAREVLAADVRVSYQNSFFTRAETFVADYALSETQQLAQNKTQAIERTLNGLRTPSDNETEEMVRRVRVRILEWYKAGWQNLLTSSFACIEWRGSASDRAPSAQRWELHPGETRVLQAQRTTYQAGTIVGTGVLILLLLLGLAWGIVRMRKRPLERG